MSTLWKGGSYRFQQLRDQDYEFAVCLGLSPFDAHCWVLPKELILQQWSAGIISSQHGGRAGSDTAWLHVLPDAIPDWLHAWGGPLSDAVRVVTRITGQTPIP